MTPHHQAGPAAGAPPLAALRHDESARIRLAEAPDTPPEMLFLLANDPTSGVRAAIAANGATPPRADQILARDEDPRVRRVLARKLAALAPGLDPLSRDRLRRVAWETLRGLVEDEAEAVRAAIAAIVSDMPGAPRELILRLARDHAMPVAEPVLRFSPLLRDEDLLALIECPPVSETVVAIARRPNLGPEPSEAIAQRAEPRAVSALLGNASARLGDAAVEALAARSAVESGWQAPLVRRPRLSPAAARTLSAIVTEELLRALAARADLDPAILRAIEERLAERRAAAPPSGGSWGMEEADFMTAARAGQAPKCARILAALSGTSAGAVARAIAERRASLLVALCWKAGLAPEAAALAQTALAGLPPSECLGDGQGWPLAEAEMRREVEALLAAPAAAALKAQTRVQSWGC